MAHHVLSGAVPCRAVAQKKVTKRIGGKKGGRERRCTAGAFFQVRRVGGMTIAADLFLAFRLFLLFLFLLHIGIPPMLLPFANITCYPPPFLLIIASLARTPPYVKLCSNQSKHSMPNSVVTVTVPTLHADSQINK